jgi:hypothetical protein
MTTELVRFPDGPLVNEGKFCLFFEQVMVAPLPASKKRKRGPNEAAVPTVAEDAEDAEVEELARAMDIPCEELAAMRADDRGEENAAGAPISTCVGGRRDGTLPAPVLYAEEQLPQPPRGRAHLQGRHLPARPRRPEAGRLRRPWPGWHRRRVQRYGVLGPATLPARPQPGQRRRLLPDAARCAVGALLRPPGPDPAPRRTRGPLPPSPPRDGRAQATAMRSC